MRGIRFVTGLALIAALAACTASAEDRARILCAAVCTCEAPPLTSAQDACVDDCAANLVGQVDLISSECEACITGHSDRCGTLEFDCEPVCQFDQPQPPPDFLDGGVTPPPVADAMP